MRAYKASMAYMAESTGHKSHNKMCNKFVNLHHRQAKRKITNLSSGSKRLLTCLCYFYEVAIKSNAVRKWKIKLKQKQKRKTEKWRGQGARAVLLLLLLLLLGLCALYRSHPLQRIASGTRTQWLHRFIAVTSEEHSALRTDWLLGFGFWFLGFWSLVFGFGYGIPIERERPGPIDLKPGRGHGLLPFMMILFCISRAHRTLAARW